MGHTQNLELLDPKVWTKWNPYIFKPGTQFNKHFEPESCWVTDFEKVLLNDSSIHTFKCINHKLALKSWNETNYTNRRLPLHLAVIINTICKLILHSNIQICLFTFLGIETLELVVLYLILIFKESFSQLPTILSIKNDNTTKMAFFVEEESIPQINWMLENDASV